MANLDLFDHPMVRQVRAELKSNPRARWLLVAMAATLVLGLALKISDHVSTLRAQLDQRSRQAAKLETIAQDAQWTDRRTVAEGLRAQLEGRLWSAENESLAKSTYSDWISTTARQTGVGTVSVRTEIDSGINNGAGVRKLSASVDGAFDASAFTRFLAEIAQNNRLVVIERLHIQSVPIQRFDMNLVTYLRPTAGAPK